MNLALPVTTLLQRFRSPSPPEVSFKLEDIRRSNIQIVRQHRKPPAFHEGLGQQLRDVQPFNQKVGQAKVCTFVGPKLIATTLSSGDATRALQVIAKRGTFSNIQAVVALLPASDQRDLLLKDIQERIDEYMKLAGAYETLRVGPARWQGSEG